MRNRDHPYRRWMRGEITMDVFFGDVLHRDMTYKVMIRLVVWGGRDE